MERHFFADQFTDLNPMLYQAASEPGNNPAAEAQKLAPVEPEAVH